MSIVFILLGALAATLFTVSKLGLHTPPAEHVAMAIVTSPTIQDTDEHIRIAA